jgi:5'-nucleotidase
VTARPLFLLSNDDGVHAPGIRALADAVSKFGDYVIVAPHVERSGSGQAISLTQPLRIERIQSNVYAVEGTPTDCVIVALQKILDRQPDWVVSGINRGSNIGQDTLYSGTVAAATEGAIAGIPAMAVSLKGRRMMEVHDYAEAVKVVRILFENEALLAPARGGILNVNVPEGPLSKMQGFVVTGLGRRVYDGAIVEGTDPRGRPYYWIGGGGEQFLPVAGSDCDRLAEGFVTLTVLSTDHAHPTANDGLRQQLGPTLDQALKRQG